MTHRAAFVHIQKTAGRSIKATFPEGLVYHAGHHRIAALRKNFACEYYSDGHADEWWSSLFKFIFVRNPWDRWLEFFLHQYSQAYDYGPDRMPKQGFVHFVCKKSTPEWDFGAFDFVGQWEHLDRDVATVGGHIGVPAPVMPHRNRMRIQRDPDWRPYYDDETRERVAKLGAWEIERFGYRFDDCASQRAA